MNNNLNGIALALSIVAVLISGAVCYGYYNQDDVDVDGIETNSQLISAINLANIQQTSDINALQIELRNLDLMDDNDLEGLEGDIENLDEDVDDIIRCIRHENNHTAFWNCLEEEFD